ncbi:hypothetical protein GLO73106DRAFT_00040600 [Gloeocapsa sp. PCC 73106]|nr:hypothetical protein GLO73106DRAFT_00040600 [Gloeocapsa sp. PCC 73106]
MSAKFLNYFFSDRNRQTSVSTRFIATLSPRQRFHSRLAVSLCLLLEDWSKKRGEVGIEWAITLKRNGEDWIPVPDLLYIS